MFKCHLLTILVFSTNQIKKKHVIDTKRWRTRLESATQSLFPIKQILKKYPIDTKLHWKTRLESAIQSIVMSWVQRSSCEDIGFQDLKN